MTGSTDDLWEQSWHTASATGPGFRSRHALLLRLMAEHGVHGHLLDVGAGNGHFAGRTHDRFPWLTLSACEAAGVVEGLRDLPFLHEVLHGDVLDGCLGERHYDAIVCAEVLEHTQDHLGLLQLLTDALQPGGRLFLTVPLQPHLWSKVDDAVGHVRRYRPGELASLCRDRGLTVERDLAFGFPLYNAYYRLLGRKPPRTTTPGPQPLPRRLATGALARLFELEASFPNDRGGRGVVVATR
jgi:trans-aconitate methyltransferase